MFARNKTSPREQYRAAEAQRVNESPALAVKFPALKSLAADLQFVDTKGATLNGHITYTMNLEVAKSVFRFSCPNHECIRGDFDLSAELAAAIAERRANVKGEMACSGWLSKATIGTVHCRHLLRYRLSLAYHSGGASAPSPLLAAGSESPPTASHRRPLEGKRHAKAG